MTFTADSIRLQALYLLGRARVALAGRDVDPSDPYGVVVRDLLDGVYSESCDDFLDPTVPHERHPATELWVIGHQVALGAAMGIRSWQMPSARVRLTAAMLWLESGLSSDARGIGR